MSKTFKVEIADDAYMRTQRTVETISRLLLDPKGGLGAPALDLFIERAVRCMSLSPILYPSEFRVGAAKLHEVIECARALRTARDRIAEVAR